MRLLRGNAETALVQCTGGPGSARWAVATLVGIVFPFLTSSLSLLQVSTPNLRHGSVPQPVQRALQAQPRLVRLIYCSSQPRYPAPVMPY